MLVRRQYASKLTVDTFLEIFLKVPKRASFKIGNQLHFKMLVENDKSKLSALFVNTSGNSVANFVFFKVSLHFTKSSRS